MVQLPFQRFNTDMARLFLILVILLTINLFVHVPVIADESLSWDPTATATAVENNLSSEVEETENHHRFPKCYNRKSSKGRSYSTLYEYLTGTGAHDFTESLTIGFFTPYNQNHMSLGAMSLAVEHINSIPTLLPGRELRFLAYNIGNNEPDMEVKSLPIRVMTEMRDNGTIAFIGGPESTCASEALVAAAWNLPLISYKCSDYQVSDKQIYGTFARTLTSASKVSKSLVALLKKFNWDQIVVILDEQRKKDRWRQNLEAFRVLAKDNGINITKTFIITDYIRSPKKISELERIVTESRDKTRVYVFMGEHLALQDLVISLEYKNLLAGGEYIIISIDDKICEPKTHCDDYIDSDWMPLYPIDEGIIYQDGSNQDESNESALNEPYFKSDKMKLSKTEFRRVKAYRSVLKIQPSYPRQENFSEIFALFANYSAKDPFGVPFHPLHFSLSEVQSEGAYLYDAVMIYARAATELLAEGCDPRNGTAIMEKIYNRSYHSIQGFDVYIDSNGDAEGNYTVLSLFEDEHGKMSMQPVGYFRQNSSQDIIPSFQYFDDTKPIQWVAGKPPKAAPACGFRNEHCIWRPDWKFFVICSIFTSVVTIAGILVTRHARYEQKLLSILWKIDMRDVVMIPTGQVDGSNGTKSTVALCRQLLGNTVMDGDAPLDLNYKKAYTRIGFYKGTVVAIKQIPKRNVDLTRNIRKELKQIRELRHENIISFIGASVETGNICILTAYSPRGSLEDVLQNTDLNLDHMFLASLVADLIKGMIYIHDSEIISHGNLKSSNCLVDQRWVLQLTDFGLHEFKACQETRFSEKEQRKLLWRAPELLRSLNPPARGTQKGDVYSFGIVLYEMIGRCGPWGKTHLSVPEIIEHVIRGNPIFRPSITHLNCGETILKCLHSCWEEDPDQRPDFRFIRVRLKEMQAGLKPSLMDNMLSIMEKYASNLEDLVQERTTQLMEEKKKTDALLHRMLPTPVAESLKRGDQVEPESFDSVTIAFSDIVGFTELSARSNPLQVVDMLNSLYTTFDSIISNYDVYKVETIGDAYMVVSGLPLRNNKHAGEVASMALHLLERIQSFKIRHRPGEKLMLRLGIHSGPVVAGVVGLKMPRYCLFGDTVNTASRMESSGEGLRIHISDVTKCLLDQLGGYQFEERGIIPIKGKGEMRTFWLVGEDPTKTRKNSTESNETQASMNNNNCLTCSFHKTVVNLNLVDSCNQELDQNDGDNSKFINPKTWLLAESQNWTTNDKNDGHYVSCSDVLNECRTNIAKRNQCRTKGFRSAPIISFMESSPIHSNSYEAPKFV